MWPTHHKRHRSPILSAAIEPIEQRLLLSASLGSNGTLTVTGTNSADTISVDFNVSVNAPQPNTGIITVKINGTTQTFSPALFNSIVINALAGDDTISVIGSAEGNDSTLPAVQLVGTTINGGDGNDNIGVVTSDEFALLNFNIDGGDGNDNIFVQGADSATIHGGDGNDTIGTAAGANTLTADIYGDDGNDALSTGSSGDARQFVLLNGGSGNDTFHNDDVDDHDTIVGGAGVDTLLLTTTASGPGDFFALDGTTHGSNTIDTDIENVTGSFDGNVTIVGNNSNNYIAVADDAGVESLVGGNGNDTLSASPGGAAGFATTFLEGDAGNDLLVGSSNGINHYSGGSGTDSVDYTKRTADLQIYLDNSHPSGDPTETVFDYTTETGNILGEHDSFDGTVEQVYSGSGNDLIVGTKSGGNALFGNAGNDTLVAQGGVDALWGGADNDTINAQDHSYDYIDAGAGIDTVTADRFDTVLSAEHVNYPTANSSLSGTVFNDANNNDKQDSGESGLAGWTVYLDLDNTGSLQNGDPTTTTDSHGNYSFTNLEAGSYIIRVIRPSGWQQTTPANGFGQHVTMTGTNTIGGLKFGERKI